MLAHGHTTRDVEDPSMRMLAREGSRHVDDAFVHEHQPFVRRCLMRFGIAGADIDDAVQDVFLVALSHAEALDVSRSPRPWLYTVALNVSRNARRKHQRAETPMAEPPEVHVPPHQEKSVHESEARSLVHRALDELPPAQRDVVMLHRLEGWPMDVVAQTVGCPVATAHSRLRLGNARLDRVVRKHALRARVATLVAAFFGAFAAPPVAAAATAAVVLVVVGAAVLVLRSEPPPTEDVPRPRVTHARASAPATQGPAETAPAETDPAATELPRGTPPVRPQTAPRQAASLPAAPSVVPEPVAASSDTAAPPAPAPPEDTLVQETRILARARALVSTSPAAARDALDAYDSRFPEGQLHRERAAIERALAAATPQ